MTTPEQRVAELQALYDELPKVECQGKCWRSCSAIDMTPFERNRIRDTTGIVIRDERHKLRGDEVYLCPALDKETHACTVHEIRPAICRVWGAAKALPCLFGCKPERDLSHVEMFTWLARVEKVAGKPGADVLLHALTNPVTKVQCHRDGETIRKEHEAWWGKYMEENPDAE